MGDSYFGGLVLLVIVGLIVVAVPAAMADGAEPNDVTGETIIVDYDKQTSVEHTGVEYNETVTIEANGATLEAGTDYDWHASTGNVTWYNTTATSNGDDGTIDYTVYQVSETSRSLGQISAIILWALAFCALGVLGMKALRVW